MCYKHQWYSYSAISSVCYGVSDMSHGHNSTVFRVLFPKISTGQKKLAPTGWHVFATLFWGEYFKNLMVPLFSFEVSTFLLSPLSSLSFSYFLTFSLSKGVWWLVTLLSGCIRRGEDKGSPETWVSPHTDALRGGHWEEAEGGRKPSKVNGSFNFGEARSGGEEERGGSCEESKREWTRGEGGGGEAGRRRMRSFKPSKTTFCFSPIFIIIRCNQHSAYDCTVPIARPSLSWILWISNLGAPNTSLL